MPNQSRCARFSIEIPKGLMRAISLLNEKGGDCRLVGGCVRDALMGNKATDYDVEVYGLDLDSIVVSLKTIGGTDLVGKSFAVVKLRTQGVEYDFTIPRTESKSGSGHRGFDIHTDIHLDAETALKRRDFTINALQYDPKEGVIIDYFGGRDDLEKGVLRHVSSAFSEDPLRALRAVQFAGRFGFVLDPETAALCRKMKREFASLAIERIWGEWNKWASKSTIPSKGLIALRDTGWISCFPEINSLLRLPQDPEWHPEGDVFIHTLHCLDSLVETSSWSCFSDQQRTTLAFAVLCHDLGKARCTRFTNTNGKLRWTSPGHDQDSGRLSEAFLARIGAPIKIVEKVGKLVENHHFLNSLSSSFPSDSSLRRLAKRIHPATMIELYQVMKADHLGRPPLVSAIQGKRLLDYKKRIGDLALRDAAPKAILLGRHLIEHGLRPGPDFKRILENAYDAQLDGKFVSPKEGIEWAQAQNLI